MIAADTSTVVAYLGRGIGADVEGLDVALRDGYLVLPCVVLTELLSDPKLPAGLGTTLRELPRLDPLEGFWERVGLLRAAIIRRGWRARLADALIAQICIDHDVHLLTRDADFRHFVKIGGLRLA